MSPLNKTLFILDLSSGPTGLLAQPSVEIEFMPHTPNQMSAFYEARGFQPAMVELLSKQCFITIRIHNTGRQTIWADMEIPRGEAVCFSLDTVTGKTRLSAG